MRPAGQVFEAGGSNVAVMEPRVEGELFSPRSHCELDDREKVCAGHFRVVDRDQAVWVLKCDGCGEEVGYPAWRRDPERVREHRLEHSGLPPFFRGREFDAEDKGQAAALKACRDWMRVFRTDPLPAPALWGEVGRGKTHLLCVVVETLIQSYGIRALYRPAVAMFDELRAAIGTDSYDGAWGRLLGCEVLAIDDLTVERGSEWEREWLAAIADHRYSHDLPILIGTNAPPDRWEEFLGDRVASRLRGMTTPYELTGPDHRYRGEQTTLHAVE